MHGLDWAVMAFTLLGIILFGLYKQKTSRSLDGYFLAERKMPWYLVLLSIMGTQASAITFLSAPGQAFSDGMRFVQYYFGLPLAMIAICLTFAPLFQNQQLISPYSWLTNRFNKKTQLFSASIFLLQRGLSTGVSIYAPALIISTILNINIYACNVLVGGLLIIYTVAGGSKAIAYTQSLQLVIILGSMALAGYMAFNLLPPHASLQSVFEVAGNNNKLNIITTGFNDKGQFNWNDKYNIWSGLIGGFFLAYSYFGTDHSQVGRYLTSKSLSETRKSLLWNGAIKIPMQFLILFIGILVFVFYQNKQHPINFNKQATAFAAATKDDTLHNLQANYANSFANDKLATKEGLKQMDSLRNVFNKRLEIKYGKKDLANDTNHVFLRFVMDYLPIGFIGLIMAIICLAAWGSISAALNSLAACTMVDFYKVYNKNSTTDEQDFKTSKKVTFLWGLFCIVVAMFAGSLGSLIEAVNVLGSLFYGVILGIFLTGKFLPKVNGTAMFYAALIVQSVIIFHAFVPLIPIAFLWLNVIGCLATMVLAWVIQVILPKKWA
jgi:solute:Na+ symporter, SSS family